MTICQIHSDYFSYISIPHITCKTIYLCTMATEQTSPPTSKLQHLTDRNSYQDTKCVQHLHISQTICETSDNEPLSFEQKIAALETICTAYKSMHHHKSHHHITKYCLKDNHLWTPGMKLHTPQERTPICFELSIH